MHAIVHMKEVDSDRSNSATPAMMRLQKSGTDISRSISMTDILKHNRMINKNTNMPSNLIKVLEIYSAWKPSVLVKYTTGNNTAICAT